MNKYIIFERDLKANNGEIISWAPKNSKGRPNGFTYWREIKNIKKGDKIYFVSNTYLVAIGEAIFDAKFYNHADLYSEPKDNSNWSDLGYGVISKVVNDYYNYNICITKELEKNLNNIKNIKPFEMIKGRIHAHQGGYCYPLSSELESFIINIISSNRKSKTKDFNDSRFVYNPIDLEKAPKKNGTSEISLGKIRKGKVGENKVNEFLNSLGFKIDDVSENDKTAEDLIIYDGHKQYSLEVKNISNQGDKHFIYLSDNQIRELINAKTRLCLYSDGNIYLSIKNCKDTFFKEIFNAINQSRKYVIDSFKGKFFAADLAILIDRDIIENYFLLINSLSMNQLVEELN